MKALLNGLSDRKKEELYVSCGGGAILFGLANSTGRNQMLMPNNLFEE